MIRQCNHIDLIWEVINDASQAYKGVIPAECWKEHYMSKKELRSHPTLSPKGRGKG
jgi:hypothetical protein